MVEFLIIFNQFYYILFLIILDTETDSRTESDES